MAGRDEPKVNPGDLSLMNPLIGAHPKWVTAEEWVRLCNAGVPWWAFWRRCSLALLRRVVDEFVRAEWVEARWEQPVHECGHVVERRVFRLAVRETPTGPVPQLLLDMRAVAAAHGLSRPS
jgi:hypothetical protein